MKRRKYAHVELARRAVKSGCPSCAAIVDSVTITQFRHTPVQPARPKLAGNPTVCLYCGALLVFTDDVGHLRVMTEAERDSIQFAPQAAQLYEMVREAAAKRAEAATKMSRN